MSDLKVKLGNPPEGSGPIYVLANPGEGVNHLTLRLVCDVEMSFTAGTAVPFSEAGGAQGSLLYLNLQELKPTEAELKSISVSAEGWSTLVETEPAGARICLAPEETYSQPADTPIEVKVEGLAAARATPGTSVTLVLQVFRVGGLTEGSLGELFWFKAPLARPSTASGALRESLTVGVEPTRVVTSTNQQSRIQNTLTLTLAENPLGPAAKAGPKTEFSLSFVYAPSGDPYGYGALCTAAQAEEAHLERGENAASWEIEEPAEGSQNPEWKLKPPEGEPLAEFATQFILHELKSELRPGPTALLLTYSEVPGFANGGFVLILEKVGLVSIESFSIEPQPAVPAGGEAKVTIAWKVANVGEEGEVTLDDEPLADPEGSAIKTLEESKEFILRAKAPPLALNRAEESRIARVRPVIDCFSVAPRAVSEEELPIRSKLDWKVEGASRVQLYADGESSEHGPSETIDRTVYAAGAITLVPTSRYEDDPICRRTAVVSAFEMQQEELPLGKNTYRVLASPRDPLAFVSFRNGSIGPGPVEVLETTGLTRIATLPIQGDYLDWEGAFSADGSILYVLVSSPPHASVQSIRIVPIPAAPGYRFESLSDPLPLADYPCFDIAASPAGDYVYVSLLQGLTVLAVQHDGSLALASKLSLGSECGPTGALAVTPDGSRIFVGAKSKNEVQVVKNDDGEHTLGAPITGLPIPEAQSLRVAAGGGLLLVGGEEAVMVAIGDPSDRNTLEVEGAAAPLPGGRYALVASGPANPRATLVLLGDTPAACRVLPGTGIRLNSNQASQLPAVQAGSARALLPGADGLQVLSFAEYQEPDEVLGAGSQVTDVVVDPGETMAVTWHDARSTFSPGTPSKGVFACEIDESGYTVAQQLSGEAVVDFAFHPREDERRAFVLTSGSSKVESVDVSASNWQGVVEIDLSTLTEGLPTTLAPSADGSTLFVLTESSSFEVELVALAIGTEGKLAAIGSAVSLFKTEEGIFNGLAAAPDGSCAYVLDELGERLFTVVRGTAGYAVQGTPLGEVGGGAVGFAISPEGETLFVLCRTSAEATLAAVDTAEMAVARSLAMGEAERFNAKGLGVSPDGSTLFVSDSAAVGIRVFDAATLRLRQTLSFPRGVRNPLGVAAAPSGTRVFIANEETGNLAVALAIGADAGGINDHEEERDG